MKLISYLILAVLMTGLISIALYSRASNVPFVRLGFAQGTNKNNEESAGIMWVGPPTVSLCGDSATVGYRFNVTVWLNMTRDIFSYQIGLLYDRNQLKCVRAGFTEGRTSEYFTGHSSEENIAIDRSLANGSVEATESLTDSDVIRGPRVESLLWIEFEVVTVPANNEKFSSKFDISTEYPSTTWIWDVNEKNIPIALEDGDYEISSGSAESVSVGPATSAILAGQSQVFWSNVSGGVAPYAFQWYVDGYAASDGTGSAWIFKPTAVGSYQVCLDVTDSSKTVMTSNIAWVIVTSPDVYNVTINAYSDTNSADVSVPITMDGSPTSFETPHTFTSILGTHTFAVSSSDLNGDPFRLWSGGASASTTIMVSGEGTYTAYYGGDQRSANAMWVEPLIVNLTGDSATIGYRFNITVWLNMSQDIFSYQIGLLYDHTQLKCTRAGFTDGGTSQYFTGHYSTALIAINMELGNGSIMAFECCLGQDCIRGPHVGSLIWAEFEVLTVPSEGEKLSSKFDINTEQPKNTWICYCDPNSCNLDYDVQFTTYDGNYEIYSTSNVSASVSPTAANMLVGQSQIFSSNVSGGTPPYTLQWYVNGYAAKNGTDPDWTFEPNTPGSYHVYLEVTDSANSSSVPVASNMVTVEANTQQSESSSSTPGSSISRSSTSGSSTFRPSTSAPSISVPSTAPAPPSDSLSSLAPRGFSLPNAPLPSSEASESLEWFGPKLIDPPAVPGILPLLLVSYVIGAGLAILLRRYWLRPRRS